MQSNATVERFLWVELAIYWKRTLQLQNVLEFDSSRKSETEISRQTDFSLTLSRRVKLQNI